MKGAANRHRRRMKATTATVEATAAMVTSRESGRRERKHGGHR